MNIFHDDFEKVSFTIEDQVIIRRLFHAMGYDLLQPIYIQFINRLKEKGVSLDP